MRGISAAASAQPWNAFAWDVAASTPAELPCYLQSGGADQHARGLRVVGPSACGRSRAGQGSPIGGTRPVFSGRPGYYADFDEPTLTFEAEGALQPVDFQRVEPLIEVTAAHAAAREDADRRHRKRPARRRRRARAGGPVRRAARLRAACCPTRVHRGLEHLTPWVHEVNLDLRLRLAAGVGARIVKRHQEAFMAKCWQQVGEIQLANRLRARLQLLTRINEVIAGKHLLALAPSVAGQIAAPLMHAIKTPFGGNRTMRADLRVRGVPDGASSSLVRRLAAKRPDVTVLRRTTAAGEPGPLRPPRPGEHVRRGSAIPGRARRAARRVEASRAAVAGASDLAQLIPAQLATPSISFDRPSFEVGPIDSATVVDAVLDRIRELPVRKATGLVTGTAAAEATTLEPIMRSPRLPLPLSAYIAEEDLDHLLPNSGTAPGGQRRGADGEPCVHRGADGRSEPRDEP